MRTLKFKPQLHGPIAFYTALIDDLNNFTNVSRLLAGYL